MSHSADFAKVYARALNLLSTRDHSQEELRRKLADEPQDDLEAVISHLLQKNYLNDQRFAQSYVHSKAQKGDGPHKIRFALKGLGLDSACIDEALASSETDWFELAHKVRCKKFGEDHPQDAKTKQKQSLFLQQRGFDFEQIHYALNPKNP